MLILEGIKKIDFHIELLGEFDVLKMSSNYVPDGDYELSKRGQSEPFYLQLNDESMGLSLEDAEQIVRELTKAINFLKE